MKKSLLLASVALAISALPALGQTSSQFEKRYGPPVKAFEVRPDVLMTVTYADDGQACLMGLEKRRATDSGVSTDTTFSDELIERLLDDLLPAAERGKKSTLYGLTRVTSRQTDFSYEHVSVTLFDRQVLIIEWTDRGCSRR